MNKYNCLCGGTATMESIISIKSMISTKPIYAWRIVCDSCKSGLYDLRGSSSREKAEEKFNDNMRIAKELASEFGVTPKQFLKTINGN